MRNEDMEVLNKKIDKEIIHILTRENSKEMLQQL